MNVFEMKQEVKEMLLRDALRLTPEEMAVLPQESIDEWNKLIGVIDNQV